MRIVKFVLFTSQADLWQTDFAIAFILTIWTLTCLLHLIYHPLINVQTHFITVLLPHDSKLVLIIKKILFADKVQ